MYKQVNNSGQIITFYSYKGGTGRTMALANIACLLACGGESPINNNARVLMIDWDLEAPGLHIFFDNNQEADVIRETSVETERSSSQLGLLEFFEGIQKYGQENTIPSENATYEEAIEFVNTINLDPYITKTFIPGLNLIKAGNFDNSYAARVIEFDWRAFHRRMPWFFRTFAERLGSEFDYVLMDSRTGLADVSGICTMLLPEKLVVVFTPNRQSLTGVPDLVRRSVRYRTQSDDLRPLVVYPLPSRIEGSEVDLDRLWCYGNLEKKYTADDKNDATQTGYQKLFEKTFKEVYGLKDCSLEKYFKEVRIQHSSKYSYGEGLPVKEEGGSVRTDMKRSYECFRDYLLTVPAPWFDINQIRIKKKIESLLEKGQISIAASSYAEALTNLTEAVKLFESINEQEDPGLVDAMQNLAEKFMIDGALNEAISCLETSLKVQERLIGNESPKLITKLLTLTELYQKTSAYEDALTTANQTLTLMERTFGSNHPKLVNLLRQMSQLYIFLEKRETAQELRERAERIDAPNRVKYRKQMLKVFLSSTARDLTVYRDAAYRAIERLDGFHGVRMEDFGARNAESDEFCRAKIAECDLTVFIVGLCHGSSPKGSKTSYTEREYQAAKDADLPRLAFLSEDGKFYDGYYRESDSHWKKQQAFRALLNQERMRDTFIIPEELSGKVAAAISNWARDHRETRPGTGKVLKAEVRGAGAIAQGSGAGAAGAGGVVIGGDVHGDVNVGVAPPDRTAEAALRGPYLRRVKEQCGYLSLTGIDPAVGSQREAEARLSLDAVYTALLTRSPCERAEEGGAKKAPQRLPERDKPLLSALEQLDRHPKLVLQGDPGSGKSTFVNFVALCLAGEALGDERVNLRYLTAPLPDEKGEDGKKPQPWRHDRLLPVPVVLRDFAATGLPQDGSASAQHLWAFIKAQLEAAALAEYVTPLCNELRERGGLLLLDGLDEVPEAERRREQVKRAVEDFVKSFGKCRVLVTSRTYAYQNQGWRLEGFNEATLAPFSDGQIRRFVANWYAHTASSGQMNREDAAGRAEQLKQAIFARPALYELAQRPLLLTLMASLHAWRGGNLPEKREALYAETIDLLLNRWEQRLIQREAQGQYRLIQPSLAEYLKVDRNKVRHALEELAFEAHRSQPELIGTADLSEDTLVSRLLRLSGNWSLVKRLVEYLRDRAGVLYPRGVGIYTFPHRSFQEYLAACYLTEDDYPDKIAGLARADPDRWREVALLAGAKAARGSAFSLWPLVEALCFREPDDSAVTTADVYGAQIAVHALVEIADLSRLSAANQHKLARIQHWLLKLLRDERLPAIERALAGDNLAALGDPRFDAEHWHLPAEPLFGFVEIPAGPFAMGSDKRRDRDAVDRELPQHEVNLSGYYLARWPVTVAQFAVFVRDSGHKLTDPNCLNGIANHPVVYVTWHDGMAYCRWLNEQLEKFARERLATADPLPESECRFWRGLADGSLGIGLPSEAEWEKAARGADGRIYPWGNEPDPNRANYGETGLGATSAVGCFSGGASPRGCEELSGNVWEWTRSRYGDYPYPQEDSKRQAWEDPAASGGRVLRGGAFDLNARYARCASRLDSLPDARSDYLGFRVVVSPSVFSDR